MTSTGSTAACSRRSPTERPGRLLQQGPPQDPAAHDPTCCGSRGSRVRCGAGPPYRQGPRMAAHRGAHPVARRCAGGFCPPQHDLGCRNVLLVIRLEPGSRVRFRRAAEDNARSVDELSLPELVALAQEVLASGLMADAAVLAMAREPGLQRLRAASRSRFETAMAQAQVD